jgi:hypothetical protein
MDPFVHQLAELSRAHVTRAKWVFVPSYAVGRTIGARIAPDGINWLNLRFLTLLDSALRNRARIRTSPTTTVRAFRSRLTPFVSLRAELL